MLQQSQNARHPTPQSQRQTAQHCDRSRHKSPTIRERPSRHPDPHRRDRTGAPAMAETHPTPRAGPDPIPRPHKTYASAQMRGTPPPGVMRPHPPQAGTMVSPHCTTGQPARQPHQGQTRGSSRDRLPDWKGGCRRPAEAPDRARGLSLSSKWDLFAFESSLGCNMHSNTKITLAIQDSFLKFTIPSFLAV